MHITIFCLFFSIKYLLRDSDVHVEDPICYSNACDSCGGKVSLPESKSFTKRIDMHGNNIETKAINFA